MKNTLKILHGMKSTLKSPNLVGPSVIFRQTPLVRDATAHTVFRCRERPIYTPTGAQPTTRDLLRAVNTWLGR